MNDVKLFLKDLSENEISQITALAVRQKFSKGQLVFTEGEVGDTFYIIEDGEVLVYFTKDGDAAPLCTLGAGEFFGEMSIMHNDRRSASVKASEDSTLLCVGADDFKRLVMGQPSLAERLNKLLTARSEELILRETLIDTTGIQGKHLYVSIKGDPSLRESALFRERYESPVDKILAPLAQAVRNLLVDFCAYQVTINFNSAEIRTRSVFDPFREALHTAERLVDAAYIDRHFQAIGYDEKIDLIRKIQHITMDQPQFSRLPLARKNIFKKSDDRWQPLLACDVIRLISKLAELRAVEHFYLRNFCISLTQDAIRMQFNCDGTHIVSSEDYDSFLDSNFAI